MTAAAPPGTIEQKRGITTRGCLLFVGLFVLVVVGGLMIGTALSRPDDPNDTAKVTVDTGTIADTDWKVTAERDVDGDTCAFLYQDGAADPVNGACSLTPQDVTIGKQTVVFGRAASTKPKVVVKLSNGETVTIPTRPADGVEGRFYVDVVDGDVDADGFASAAGS
jgi:hypothetical protein